MRALSRIPIKKAWRYWIILAAVGSAGCASSQKQDPFLLLEKKMYETAEQEFRLAVRQHPDRGEYRDGLGAALAGQKRFQEGCPLLSPTSKPISAPACWIAAASNAAAADRHSTVLSYARRVDTQNWPPADIQKFYTISAEAARRESDWDHLIEAYPRLLSAQPEDAKLHYLYARALEQRKYYEQAYREYQMAVELDPKNDDVKRYLNRLKAQMEKGSTSAAARIENIDTEKSGPTKDDMRVRTWEHGSVEAVIKIESMETVEKDADISTEMLAVPVELISAHWPSNVEPGNVLAQISRLAMNMQCPAVGAQGRIVVTVGPNGTVRNVESFGIKPVVQDCVGREIKAWIFNQLRGGYLKFAFPFPQLNEADLYGGTGE